MNNFANSFHQIIVQHQLPATQLLQAKSADAGSSENKGKEGENKWK
jgi:hypothetical protein